MTEKMQRTVTWHKANGDDCPDGILLVEVELQSGESEVKIVYIDDDCQTLIEPEFGDVWTAWLWQDVSRYCLIDDILLEKK